MARTSRVRAKSSFARNEQTKEQEKRILIVCEGSKTEPDYLDDLRRDKGLNQLNVYVHRTGSRSSPMTVVNDAKNYLDKIDSNFDEVYCVFDKDRHTDFANAIDACKNETKTKFIAITSIICFEVWILMHFSPSLKAYTCYDELIIDLKKISSFKKYKKGLNGIYALTKHKLGDASKAAKHAENEAVKCKTDNPTTKVYVLVEAIRKMAQ